MAAKGKGSAFERYVCRELSLWYTNGKRDDLFWRSAMSGGMATVRGRKGANTEGQHGDIAATTKAGQQLLAAVTIEVKRGYSDCNISDLIERKPGTSPSQLEKFVNQATKQARQANTESWLLVWKRDHREIVVYMDTPLFIRMFHGGANIMNRPRVYVQFSFKGRKRTTDVTAIPYTEFLKLPPSALTNAAKAITQEKNNGTNH